MDYQAAFDLIREQRLDMVEMLDELKEQLLFTLRNIGTCLATPVCLKPNI